VDSDTGEAIEIMSNGLINVDDLMLQKFKKEMLWFVKVVDNNNSAHLHALFNFSFLFYDKMTGCDHRKSGGEEGD
jgi:hypothetical protein